MGSTYMAFEDFATTRVRIDLAYRKPMEERNCR